MQEGGSAREAGGTCTTPRGTHAIGSSGSTAEADVLVEWTASITACHVPCCVARVSQLMSAQIQNDFAFYRRIFSRHADCDDPDVPVRLWPVRVPSHNP